MATTFAKALLNWFDKFGRKNLPWQKEISPYRVWISEIMLQQTQVATVIPYFEKFISTFPTIKKLADANLDDVLHLWTGLGYYARARNIHKSAKIIAYDLKNKFPNDLESLMSLPGIGRSTAGAILSIAFQKPTPILDGNVRRVLSRYYAVSGFPNDKESSGILWSHATNNTPSERVADYTQAIMDLGATVCTRSRPQCSECPLKTQCIAYKENRVSEFPQTKSKGTIPVRTTNFLIIRNEEKKILLQKRPPTGIWGGLWGFPECKDDVLEYCKNTFGCKVVSRYTGDIFRHTFTHFHLDISPIYIEVKNSDLKIMDSEMLWSSADTLPKVGLSAPVKKLLQRKAEIPTKKE